MAENNELSRDNFQKKLIENLLQIFDLVISDRRSYYQKNPKKRPDPKSVKAIIDAYSNANTVVSGGMSLIPGPWGMVAVIPEIGIVIRNQLAMVYDIGVAYGKEHVMTRELLAGVFLSATGTGAGTLLVMHGGKILVRRVALRTFQKVVAILAGRITQQVIKSAVGKWLPVIGAAVIAAWSNMSTRSIGNKAIEILQKDIELSDEIIDADVIQSTIQEQSQPVQATTAPVEEEKKTPKAIPAKVKAAQKKPGVKTAQRKSPGRGGKQVSNTRRAVKSQKPKRISKSKPKAIGRRKAPSR